MEMVNHVILRQDTAGVLRDQEGHVCNEQGQRLDENGNPIVPVVIMDVHVMRKLGE